MSEPRKKVEKTSSVSRGKSVNGKSLPVSVYAGRAMRIISKAELDSILAKREELKSVKAKMEKLANTLKEAETVVIDAILNSVPLAADAPGAMVEYRYRKNPEYKAWLIDAIGETAVEAKVAKVIPNEYTDLVITPSVV